MKLTEGKEEARWKGLLRVSSPFIAAAALLSLTLFLAIVLPKRIAIENDSTFFCTPDAQFQLPASRTNIWNPQALLWITLAFGQFSFASAKALDFAWDLVFGRFGQFLLIYWSYPLIRRALLRAVGRVPIKYDLYASLAFEKVSLTGALSLMRGTPLDESKGLDIGLSDRQRNGDRDDRTLMHDQSFLWRWFAILPLFIYLIAFPTLMSVMTGYQAGLTPYARLPNGDLIPASKFVVPPLVVVDGSRIGLTDAVASQPGDEWAQSVSNCKIPYLPSLASRSG